MQITDLDMLPISSINTDIPPRVKDTRQPYQRELAVHLLLASVLFERIAFYSLSSNLVVYLESKKLHWDYSYSATAVQLFYGATYIWTFLFAIISDMKLGRIKVIIIGFIIYLMGFTILTVVAKGTTNICEFNVTMHLTEPSIIEQRCAPAILTGLMLTAMGAGGVKSAMVVLGAEQIQEGKRSWIYFDKYVIAANLGNFIATSAIPYIQNPTETSYFVAYLLSNIMLFISAFLFIISIRYYLQIDVHGTLFTKCIPVYFNAFQTWRQRNRRSLDKKHIVHVQTVFGNRIDEDEEEDDDAMIQKTKSFLDYAKESNHGKFSDQIVEDVKSLRRVLVVFILLIPFSLIYSQTDSTFPLQGKQMKGNDVRIVTLMALANPVIIIVGILLQTLFVCKWLQDTDRAKLLVRQFIIGMIIACIAMIIAGGIEALRQSMCDDHSTKDQSNLPIYYQLFEHIGIGLAELFVTVACYKFAYFAAPYTAQTLFMSIRFCSLGAASFLGVGYMAMFSSPSYQFDFSCKTKSSSGDVFYSYYLILAVLQLIVIIIFILCQKKYGIVRLITEKIEQKRISLFFTNHADISEIAIEGVF